MTKIAVSSGDPAGIGPDICIKAFDQISKDCLPIFFGNIELFKERAELLRIKINIEEYTGDNKKQHSSDSLKLVNQTLNENVIPGEPSLHSANYTLNNFKQSVKRTLDGEFDAIVTCPINKQLINDSGIAFTGHTEELAQLSNTQQVVMMLVNEKIKVALASTHLPIREVPSFLNEELLKEIILITNESLKKNWGIANPLIKVLGLNPHAGDGGHIGKEEQEFITPAINYLKNKGLNIIGPLSADTAFVEKNSEKADVFIAMFHDQGLPVIKALGFGETVNITLGLPFIRTSVDHGTAYDISGTGAADESSLLAAIEVAKTMSKKRNNA